MSDPSPLPPIIPPAPPVAVLAPVSEELPEVSWLWRRVYIFIITLLTFAILAYTVWHIKGQDDLTKIALSLILLSAFYATLYLCGSSATDVWKLVTALRTKRTILAGGQENQ